MEGLRKSRLRSKLTLNEMADIMKVTPANFSLIERGLAVAQSETRKKLEMILGKINWLDVPEFDLDEIDSTWSECERQFRNTYRKVKSLPIEERKAFVKSAIKHLRKLNKMDTEY